MNVADAFLACLLLGTAACVFWREILYALLVLGAAMICMAVFYVVLGVQFVVQAS